MKRPEHGVGPVLKVAVQATRNVVFVTPDNLNDREPAVYTVFNEGTGPCPRYVNCGPFCAIDFKPRHVHWRHQKA